MLIAPAFLRLDAVLNVDNKGDTAALLLRGFGGAGAPALDALRYGFLCIIRAERFQTGKVFLPRCAARYALRGDGIPICSFDGGYYYAATEEELRRTIRQLRSRIKKIAFAERGLSRTLPDYEDTGQLSLPLEGGDTS